MLGALALGLGRLLGFALAAHARGVRLALGERIHAVLARLLRLLEELARHAVVGELFQLAVTPFGELGGARIAFPIGRGFQPDAAPEPLHARGPIDLELLGLFDRPARRPGLGRRFLRRRFLRRRRTVAIEKARIDRDAGAREFLHYRPVLAGSRRALIGGLHVLRDILLVVAHRLLEQVRRVQHRRRGDRGPAGPGRARRRRRLLFGLRRLALGRLAREILLHRLGRERAPLLAIRVDHTLGHAFRGRRRIRLLEQTLKRAGRKAELAETERAGGLEVPQILIPVIGDRPEPDRSEPAAKPRITHAARGIDHVRAEHGGTGKPRQLLFAKLTVRHHRPRVSAAASAPIASAASIGQYDGSRTPRATSTSSGASRSRSRRALNSAGVSPGSRLRQ